MGLGTVMLANAWIFEAVRYAGAGYLLFLAVKSAKSALSRGEVKTRSVRGSRKALYSKGLALHITNPKAILFFGSLYAIGVPADASLTQLFLVIGSVGLQSIVIFHGYALLFSTASLAKLYVHLRRWFEGLFVIGFGLTGLKIITARLQ
jgi:threonine/homoserine/homoserine lactone efflux protein